MVDCLTCDGGVTGSSLTGDIVLVFLTGTLGINTKNKGGILS